MARFETQHPFAGLSRRIRVSDRQSAILLADSDSPIHARIPDDVREEVLRRYGKPVARGRCLTKSEFPGVTAETIARDLQLSISTVRRIITNASRKRNRRR